MPGNHVTLTATLVVKADTSDEARAFAIEQLNKWFIRDHDDWVEGFGYPVGSLLHYGVREFQVPAPPSPSPDVPDEAGYYDAFYGAGFKPIPNESNYTLRGSYAS